jgi:DNA (cytosine-5)-methyltransferase 1
VTLTFGSLFSGIGGFDLALERSGMQCAWQVEIDKNCQNILRRHFPNSKLYEDVRNVGRNNLESVDLICGGFPCQDLSVAGRRAGLAGERSGLWFEFHRIIEELNPQWVVVENVPGLLSSNGGCDFAIVIRGLVQCGYGIAYRILDARYFGVPQRRRRVFIVGSLGDGCAAQILFEREGMPGNLAASGEAREGVARDIETSPCLRSDGHDASEDGNGRRDLVPVSYAVNAGSNGARRYDGESETFVLEPRFVRNGLGAPNSVVPPLKAQGGQTGKRDSAPVVAFARNARNEVRLIAGDGQIIGALPAQPGMKQQNYIAPVIGFSACRDGGDAAQDIMPTLKHGGDEPSHHNAFKKPAIASRAGVRRLTPVECERLQGFPDDHTACGIDESGKRVKQSDSARYRQLGNAVCVPVVEWIAKRIAEAKQ